MPASSYSIFFLRFILIFLVCFLSIKSCRAAADDTWKDLELYGGQIYSVVMHPEESSILYAGSWGGEGLFTTTNSGETWAAVPSDNASWFKNIAVFDIAVNPHDPENIWVANADYIDVSWDAGLTWDSLDFASREGRFCFTVAVDPHDISGSTIYVGTGGPGYTDRLGRVFKSIDRGTTWQKTGLISAYTVFDLHVSPVRPNELWVACNTYQISPHGQICTTSDGGVSWTKWNFNWYVDELALHPHTYDLIFAGGQQGVIIKDDEWKNLEPSTLCSSLCIPPANPQMLYAGLADMLAVTTDLGATWNYHGSPGEFFTLCADTVDSQILYGGHANRGLFKTTDSGATWSEINNGIKANTIFAAAVSPHDNQTILAATLSGVYKSRAEKTWELLNSEPSETAIFHPLDNNTLYAGFDWQMGKSTD